MAPTNDTPAITPRSPERTGSTHLKTLHVSRLKIPRMMMKAGTENPGSAAMVRAIISIARELNIEVVAQGIETEAEQALLTPAASTTIVKGSTTASLWR